MNILVTGGAGYIGSFMVKALLNKGYSVTVIDSLERGYKEAVHPQAKFIQGSLLDLKFIDEVFHNSSFDGIIHFAGYISVAESMKNPYIYFQNNIYSTLHILDKIKNSNAPFIFSSTAAVYGNPIQTPLDENHPKSPTNPYGESKLIVEKILNWYNTVFKLPVAVLRYFNASGAAIDGSSGEMHNPESHIIPLAMRALLNDNEFTLYGNDYYTPDKTCIRDYIHVLDLVEAHILAFESLRNGGNFLTYNVGTGIGHSNKEVIDSIQKITRKKIRVKEVERRPGDVAILVADPSKIKDELKFFPKYSDLNTIVETAWRWHLKKQNEK